MAESTAEVPVTPSKKPKGPSVRVDLQKINADLLALDPLKVISPRIRRVQNAYDTASVFYPGVALTSKQCVGLSPKPMLLSRMSDSSMPPLVATGTRYEIADVGRVASALACGSSISLKDFAFRSLTAQEYSDILVPASAAMEDESFKRGYFRVCFHPSLAERQELVPELLKTLNSQLAQINAEVLSATAAFIIHENHDRQQPGSDAFNDYNGVELPALYAGPGFLSLIRLEDVIIPGTIAFDEHGRFLASEWCQRVWTGDLTHSQYNIKDNNAALIVWLGGPATEKFIGKKLLKRFGEEVDKPQMYDVLQLMTKAFYAYIEALQRSANTGLEVYSRIIRNDLAKYAGKFFAVPCGSWYLYYITPRGISQKQAVTMPAYDGMGHPMSEEVFKIAALHATTPACSAEWYGYVLDDTPQVRGFFNKVRLVHGKPMLGAEAGD